MNIFKTSVNDRIKMAPDDGAGSGAPVSAPPAATPAPAPESSAPQADTAKSDFINDIRSQMQSAAEKIRAQNAPSENRGDAGTPLPDGLVANNKSAEMAQPLAATDPNAEKKPEPIAEQIKAVSQDRPASIRIDKFGREFSLSEIERAIEAENYYHPKVLEIQASAQRLAAEEQRINSLKEAPEVVLIEALKGNDFLRAKVTELFDQMDPETLNGYKQTAQNAAKSEEVQKLEARLGALEQERQQFIQQEQQRQIQAHDQAVRGSVERYVTDARAKLSQEGIQLNDADLNAYAKAAMSDVMQQQLKYEPQAVTEYFARLINAEAEKQRSIRRATTEAHTQARRNLPPPPPTGGGAPVLKPSSPKDFTEAKSFMADRLQAALNGLNGR